MDHLIVLVFTIIMCLISRCSSIPSSVSSIYDVFQSNGLPIGLIPNGVTNFTVDPTNGRFEYHLEQTCDAKFESQVRFDWNVSGTLRYGQIAELSGVTAQELFLWFPVKAIRVDIPSSGIIYFDVGVVYKQYSLSMFETPRDCAAVDSLSPRTDMLLFNDRGRNVESPQTRKWQRTDWRPRVILVCKSLLRVGFLQNQKRMALKAPITGLSVVSTPSASLQTPSNSLVVVRAPPLKSYFFGGGVRALKVTQIRLAHSSRSRCNGHGGGALGAQMNLFDRFARVVKSYANAIISSFEDPEKILEQTVLEMNDDLTKMRQATAQVLASQKQLENKYKVAQQASEDWYRRAQLALEKGDEDLAREALKRRKSYADNANALKAQLDQQKSVVDNLVSNTRVGFYFLLLRGTPTVMILQRPFVCKNFPESLGVEFDQLEPPLVHLLHEFLLESKIQEAKSKKDTLRARAQSAKTATKVSEMLGNVSGNLEVLAMESQAEALNQLTTDDLEGKFALLESSSVDDDLANLKKELSGSTKKGELPPGRTAVASTNSAFPFRDTEIEKELNELRRKAKEF
ncbi:hypothetical protein F0562_031164 [Nyssa sinensis]|uniref:Uncharacterized protein n=1 Tax=Nyssa sinensis TaxID=561372 RepID=A0A5J5AUJ6_9ASTE|nr:hypothetical protein F0562_031164 [Nyssa sinensis]